MGDNGPRRRLSYELVEALRQGIASGKFSPGDRLPTEAQLAEQYGVSRTVVREAVAGLRANGLVEARQGSGVYVTGSANFGISEIAGGRAGLASILDLLELRTPLEIEAAGLAAIRRTAGQDLEIRIAYEDLGAAIARGDSAASKDFDFHLAIAEATNNHNFVEVLTFLGRRTIPRGQLGGAAPAIDQSYLEGVQSEHGRIVAAISRQDAVTARDEMRTHLIGSQSRYRMLLANIQPQEKPG
jgi:DNA-binding FadR family transcriptional regulator